MLDHDELRVEQHMDRYTRTDVADMWKSYLAAGMSGMDEKPSTNGKMEGAPTFEDLGMK